MADICAICVCCLWIIRTYFAWVNNYEPFLQTFCMEEMFTRKDNVLLVPILGVAAETALLFFFVEANCRFEFYHFFIIFLNTTKLNRCFINREITKINVLSHKELTVLNSRDVIVLFHLSSAHLNMTFITLLFKGMCTFNTDHLLDRLQFLVRRHWGSNLTLKTHLEVS